MADRKANNARRLHPHGPGSPGDLSGDSAGGDYLIEHAELQDRLRGDSALINSFIEEMLRLERSSKVTFRLARKDTEIGELAIPAGTGVVLSLAGEDRDPARWPAPHTFELGRPRIKEHLAFERGEHPASALRWRVPKRG